MMEVSSLSATYPNGFNAVKRADFNLASGKILALVGESGSGKSTLIYACLGLLPKGSKVSGKVLFDQIDFLALPQESQRRIRWKKVSLILQGTMNSFTPVLTIKRQFLETMEEHLKLTQREAEAKAAGLLEEVGLDDGFLSRYPHEMSGGQKQRCAIAMALCCDPDYLLADEPTTALDVITQAEIMNLLKSIVRRRNMGMLMVTHDLALASSTADEICVMYQGCTIETERSDVIIRSPKQPHTIALVKSLSMMEE